MHIPADWKLAIISLVASCLIITQVESAAFAQGQPANPPVAAPQTQNPTPAAATQPAPTPAQTKPRSIFRRFKWILIGAAAAGGAAAVILLKNRKGPEPVVTVGGPTVGNPQ